NFSKSSCCICHSTKRLLYEHGLSPTIVELDEDPRGREIELIVRLIGCSTICASRVQWGDFVGDAKAILTLQIMDSARGNMLPPVNVLLLIALRTLVLCGSQMDHIARLASQKAVVIFSKSSCCMSHAIKRLFYEHGVSPMIIELDENSRGREMELALIRLGCIPSVPAVFIGGRFVGNANAVMTLQVNGSLKKMLKDAGAI
ncbi:hypothetical protein RJ640_014886, partial [Escallonia rubra]